MSQDNNNGAIAITVALIGLVGVIAAALIGRSDSDQIVIDGDFDRSTPFTTNQEKNKISSNLTTICRVTRPYGLYVFDQPNQYSGVLMTLPQNSKVELKSLDFSGQFAKVNSSSGSGWVSYHHLSCS